MKKKSILSIIVNALVLQYTISFHRLSLSTLWIASWKISVVYTYNNHLRFLVKLPKNHPTISTDIYGRLYMLYRTYMLESLA